MEQSLLIVEDDEPTRSFLSRNLEADGFRVAAATGASEALRQIEVRHPHLVLLDLGLDEGSGLQLLDRVRTADGVGSRIDPQLPVIVVTGRGGSADRVRGFDRGADDFLVKPFAYGELLGRIRAVLRRASSRPRQGLMVVGELVVDPQRRVARIDGRKLDLSPKEFSLLMALAEQPTRVVPKVELLRNVWGYVSVGRTRTVDTHACRLRRRMAEESERPWVMNVRGVGYRLTEGPV